MKKIKIQFIMIILFLLFSNSIEAITTEEKVDSNCLSIARLESEIAHLQSELNQDMKPKIQSVDKYLMALERIRVSLEQMQIESSSIRASSDQTEKRIVEMEKKLNDNIQKILNDTSILHSKMSGELNSTRMWLQIIVGGIVVGMLMMIIQILMQRRNVSPFKKKEEG